MLTELFYPIMPGFAVLFVVLNIFQLHFIVTKLARNTDAEPSPKTPESLRESKQSATLVAVAITVQAPSRNETQKAEKRQRIQPIAAPNPPTQGEIPEKSADDTSSDSTLVKDDTSQSTLSQQSAGDTSSDYWLKWICCKFRLNGFCSAMKWFFSQLLHPAYAVILFAATILLFSAVFMLPGARVTATGVLPLDPTSVVFSFLAVTKLYYMPAFVSHVWLASLLFVVQAMIKYWRDRRRVDNWVCYPVDERVPQVFESITLILGMLSFLIGIATPQMLGQLR